MTALWFLWRYKALIGMAALGLVIGWLKLQNAHLEAKVADLKAIVATLNAEVDLANAATRQCKAANDATLQSHDRAKADYGETVRALERELARLGDEKQKVQIVRKVIREQAAKCDGVVPPGIGAAIEWLRVNPDQQGGGGRDGDPVRTPGHPGVAPGLPR